MRTLLLLFIFSVAIYTPTVLLAQADDGQLDETTLISPRSTQQFKMFKRMTTSNGEADETLEMTIDKDGNRQVVLNGEEIDSDRVQENEHGIVILDADGEVMLRIPLPAREIEELELTPLDVTSFPFREVPTAHQVPDTIIGVHFSSVGAALASQLRLAEGEGVVMTEVIDTLPAHMAGLEVHDIVTHVDNDVVDSLAFFRNAIAERTPGETVILRVIRQGEVRDIPVLVGRRADYSLSEQVIPGLPLRLSERMISLPRDGVIIDVEPLEIPSVENDDVRERLDTLRQQLQELEARLEALRSATRK